MLCGQSGLEVLYTFDYYAANVGYNARRNSISSSRAEKEKVEGGATVRKRSL